jgi:hypothetical protein
MMPTPEFLHGVSACASWAAGVFFLRYWRETADRFFAWFAGAFWILSLNSVAVATIQPAEESRHLLFLLRLIAFALILAAVWDKNRR